MNNFRIAVVSTPRTGNTWLRHLLTTLYDLSGIVANGPADVDWASLPDRCVLQIHWRPHAEFRERLRQYGFRVVVMARHPIDVLISILHFAVLEPTGRWLEGEGGNEHSILGAMPRSNAFLDYAAGPRAAALLAVSQEWWRQVDCFRVQYEKLVQGTGPILHDLIAWLGESPRKSVEQAVTANTLNKLRSQTQVNHHFWQGRPDLWRTLLTVAEASRLFKTHAELFGELGYTCEASPSLDGQNADANWIKLAWSDLADDLQNVRAMRRTLVNLEARCGVGEAELRIARAKIEKSQPYLSDVPLLHFELQKALIRANELESLGPVALGVARRVHGLLLKMSAVSRNLKRLKSIGRGLGSWKSMPEGTLKTEPSQ